MGELALFIFTSELFLTWPEIMFFGTNGLAIRAQDGNVFEGWEVRKQENEGSIEKVLGQAPPQTAKKHVFVLVCFSPNRMGPRVPDLEKITYVEPQAIKNVDLGDFFEWDGTPSPRLRENHMLSPKPLKTLIWVTFSNGMGHLGSP